MFLPRFQSLVWPGLHQFYSAIKAERPQPARVAPAPTFPSLTQFPFQSFIRYDDVLMTGDARKFFKRRVLVAAEGTDNMAT